MEPFAVGSVVYSSGVERASAGARSRFTVTSAADTFTHQARALIAEVRREPGRSLHEIAAALGVETIAIFVPAVEELRAGAVRLDPGMPGEAGRYWAGAAAAPAPHAPE